MMEDRPLIIRNRAPWIVRGFVFVWMAGVVLITFGAVRQNPQPEGKLWPYVLALFWVVGVALVAFVLTLEDGELEISRRGQATVRRGPFWARREHMLYGLDLKIVQEPDSDGAPYFKLMLAAPPRPLAIAEGHKRDRVEAIRQRIEAAHASAKG